MIKLLTLLFLSTNIINTSSSYDRSALSPFRLEKITANYDTDNINISVDYYINSHQSTEIYLSVNNHSQQDVLSSTRAKKSLRNIKLSLPNDGENNKLDIHFSAIWSQEYTMDGTLFFPNGKKDSNDIKEPGEYRYKIIKDISFTNRNKKFSYRYDYIDLNLYPQKTNSYTNFESIIDIDNSNTTNKIKLFKNEEMIYQGDLKSLKHSKLLSPGNYNANFLLNIKKVEFIKPSN